ncbi:hypothetical protein FEM48_Zijuj07G0021200 [Ziziphus jujuba var. spinosa]|uniref:Uncharacterized protein n=1 Tax=Ziziphus jujuba var. spinosa TaxID=714518 RepID=A0A978V1U4_ZIZJJ|nr:hypothetical protein FEM48_Zijuj07G0021200 [Ziziphus jujuba var. spinosa]
MQRGDTEDDIKPKKIAFVIVGTTCFDALVGAVDTQAVKRSIILKRLDPQWILCSLKSEGGDGSIAADHFTFSSSNADINL